MAGETNDADAEADRLEAALERLVILARAPRSATAPDSRRARNDPPAPVDEITARLDGLIGRLRTALGSRAG